MTKKIGIVTINGKHNYGNRLQNYALQKAVSSYGIDVVTILEPSKFSTVKFIKSILKPILRYTPLYGNRHNYVMKKLKSKGFNDFDDKFIVEEPLSKRNIDSFDLFISGSDQVWNPKFAGKDFHFLTFAPKTKRVSYAASFGISEIPHEHTHRYRDNINSMKHISVREAAGVDIVRDLTGRDATLVPDPTMLLTRNDWGDLVADYEHLKNEKYVIVYTLREFDEDVRKQIETYAAENNLKIYQIMGDFYSKDHKTPDPVEFVARIKYADAVFTDSFHASVFSIIMHTPFVVFSRKDANMSSRLVTLLNTYKLQQALYDGSVQIEEILHNESFDNVDSILAEKANIGKAYLCAVLDA